MNVASQMLSTKNYNVNEVALHLGYSTASHFINAFKNKFGTTPKISEQLKLNRLLLDF